MRLAVWNFFTAQTGSTLQRPAPSVSVFWSPRRWYSKPIAAPPPKCDWPTPIVAIWNWSTRSNSAVWGSAELLRHTRLRLDQCDGRRRRPLPARSTTRPFSGRVSRPSRSLATQGACSRSIPLLPRRFDGSPLTCCPSPHELWWPFTDPRNVFLDIMLKRSRARTVLRILRAAMPGGA
jgi:hypothetical protein